jgi:hypothetical protein
MRDEMNLPKIIVVLAIAFVVSLGLCGLTAIAADRVPGVAVLGFVELAVMLLSDGGLVA